MSNEATMLEALKQGYDAYTDKANSWLRTYKAEGGQVYCQAGCFGCCNMPIWVSLAEALYVMAALSDTERAAMSEHARKVQANAQAAPSEDEYVERHRLLVGYCPLLDPATGGCSHYGERPTRCRDTYSAFPADCCQVGFWQSLSRREQANYQRAVARHPATDGDTHYIAPLEYLSESIWKNAAKHMRRAWGVEVWGDYWTLCTLAANEDFMRAVRSGQVQSIKKVTKALGLYHERVIEITKKPVN